MKRNTALILSAFIVAASLAGCMTDGEGADTTDTQKIEETTIADTTIQQPDADTVKLFEENEVEGGYSYVLYNLDGTVAEEIAFCEDRPCHVLIGGSVSKVTVGNETYYYDLEEKVFSETFTDVFDENGSLILRAEGGILIVCDAFDSEGFHKEIDDFSFDIAEESPFVSCEFSDDGGSVKCVYMSSEGQERTEGFNITDETKYVPVDDWKNKKELVSGDEKAQVEQFLYGYMGNVDYNTGFSFEYEISGAILVNGVRFYHCKCFYLMPKEGSEEFQRVPAAEFVLSENKAERYDCRDVDGELIVYTENNMI